MAKRRRCVRLVLDPDSHHSSLMEWWNVCVGQRLSLIHILQAAAKAFINREIEGFGVVTELAIDTSKKTMRVELDLIGEASRILINVASYELSEKNGEIHIAVPVSYTHLDVYKRQE